MNHYLRTLLVSLLALPFLAACTTDECQFDSDCQNGRCIDGGGIFFGGNFCDSNGSFQVGEDAGVEDDVDLGPENQNQNQNQEEDPCDGVDCGNGTCQASADGTSHTCTCHLNNVLENGVCVPEEQPDPCEGVTCSGHGTCEVVSGFARCDCDPGYVRGSSQTCVEENPADPCDGITCSGYGTCQVVGGAAQCSCDENFQADGLDCVLRCDGGIDTDGVCDYWILRAGSNTWEGYYFDPYGDDANAPAAPIRAAFAAEDAEMGFVFTTAGIHAFYPNTQTWGPQRNHSAYHFNFPNSQTIRSAWGVPSRHPNGNIRPNDPVSSSVKTGSGNSPSVWIRRFNVTTDQFTAEGSVDVPVVVDDWSTRPNAPLVNSTRASWLDIANSRGWATTNICPDHNQVVYFGHLTPTHVHLQDGGFCFHYATPIPINQFPPFNPSIVQGRPPMDQIGGAMWYLGALILFRG